jgi:predicted ferric reductase
MKPIRQHFYSYFYFIHVVFFTLAVVMLCVHDLYNMKAIVLMGLILAVIDRSIRVVRTLLYSRKMTTTLHPLAGGATKIKIKNEGNIVKFQPGSHAFLRLPGISKFQSHPFTISARKETEIEMTVRSMSGFTKTLHAAAVQTPGAQWELSFDGPYGRIPDFRKSRNLLLIAGGIGASFTFPIAIDIVEAGSEGKSVEKVIFVWAVRDKSTYSISF